MAEVSPVFRRGSVPAAIDTRFLDHLPSAVLLCDPVSLVIRYANGRSLRLLESVRHMLPVAPEEMVGSALSLLHPAFEEVIQLIEETGDAARKLVLTGHGERLEFHVQALRDMNGRPGFLQVTWSVTTALVAQEDEAARLRQMVEQLPLNVVTCRLPDMTIDYANAAARRAFEQIKVHLPGAGENLVGAPVGLFIAADRLSHVDALPFTFEVPAGDSVLVFKASALRGPQGQYLAPLLTFDVRSALLHRLPDTAAMGAGQALRTDDVLASLRSSIGRIRTVAETIERISAQGRGGVSIAPLAVAPVMEDGLPAEPARPDATAEAGAPESPPEGESPVPGPEAPSGAGRAPSYASRFGRHVGRLLHRKG